MLPFLSIYVDNINQDITSRIISLCVYSRARPFNRSGAMVVRSYDLKILKIVKDFSAIAVEIGNVAKIFKRHE